jgi:hypothetical protein
LKKKRLSEKLTEKVLRELCESGETDAAIGKAYGMTGEGVAYRRKKYGISSGTSHRLSSLEKISTEVLRRDYYALNQYDFSKKYSVSKTVWRRVLKDRSISSKASKKGWDSDSTERAVALLKSGRNLTQIAAELGVCRTSVGRLFKRTGVSYRPRNRLAPSWLGEHDLVDLHVRLQKIAGRPIRFCGDEKISSMIRKRHKIKDPKEIYGEKIRRDISQRSQISRTHLKDSFWDRRIK